MNTEYLKQNGVDLDKALELFGDINTYNDTIKEFVKTMPESLENLKKYKEVSDMQNYGIYAHSIKSDSKYFGFTKLSEMALGHEMAGKNNNMYFVTEHFEEFKSEIEKDLNIARKYLGQDVVEESKEVIKSDISILVVDDSDVIKKFIESIFNNKYNVITAKDGVEAINIINTDQSIKKILLDLNMPNFNGLQVLEYFKQNNLFDRLDVTVITGIGSEEVLNKAKEYPIDGIILKPFNEKNIRNAVEGV